MGHAAALPGVRLALPQAALRLVEGRFLLRDPRARSRDPAILREGPPGGERLLVRGPFFALHEFRIAPEDGRRFVEATDDPNPIHREGDIVPGAMTIARTLLPFEALFPALAIRSIHAKFTSIARYGGRLRARTRLAFPEGPGATLASAVFQGGVPVAQISARAEIAAGAVTPIPRPMDADAALARVEAFLESVHLPAAAWLEPATGPRYACPAAFVAALPSGSYVRRFSDEGGIGGILNSLFLEFDGPIPVPLALASTPGVECVKEAPKRSFYRVLTKVFGNMMTFARGFAILQSGKTGP